MMPSGWLPKPFKLGASRALGEIKSAHLKNRLQRMATNNKSILAGPWLGEVGFELLYWVPFLAWFAKEFSVSPNRIVAVSRGGSESWYRHIAATYLDLFEMFSVSEFKQRNIERQRQLGEQKQLALTDFDRFIVSAVKERLGESSVQLLHPSEMYALFKHYWWGHTDELWIHRHTRYSTFSSDVMRFGLDGLPDKFTAVKFYFSKCFPQTTATRAFVSQILDRLREEQPVVSLSTGFKLDDHSEWEPCSLPRQISRLLTPQNNLQIQSAIVSRATKFVGTYGGFSYLAPFFGVRSMGVYADADAFSKSHLRMMRSVIDGSNFGAMQLVDSSADRPREIS